MCSRSRRIMFSCKQALASPPVATLKQQQGAAQRTHHTHTHTHTHMQHTHTHITRTHAKHTRKTYATHTRTRHTCTTHVSHTCTTHASHARTQHTRITHTHTHTTHESHTHTTHASHKHTPHGSHTLAHTTQREVRLSERTMIVFFSRCCFDSESAERPSANPLRRFVLSLVTLWCVWSDL
jgi:hypothetical protein